MNRRRVTLIFLTYIFVCGWVGHGYSQQEAPVRHYTDGQTPSVVVDPISLTQVTERILTGLNVGAVVTDEDVGAGIQKAGDAWGLHIDLFVDKDKGQLSKTVGELAKNGAVAIIVEGLPKESEASVASALEAEGQRRGGKVPLIYIGPSEVPFATDFVRTNKPGFDDGFAALRRARNQFLALIPKYDELFPIAFPITPLPDTFFQASKYPYPEPVIRSVRTVSSTSASAHAHTSCHAVALLGNMIHRTSKADPEIFLLGFEGGNLSIKALEGATSRDKLSAVMTSYVFAIRGNAGERRDLLSENDRLETSAFKPSVNAPEELQTALGRWKSGGLIKDYRLTAPDEVVIDGFKGASRKFRASFFLISSDRKVSEPQLEIGVDKYGRWVFELITTQRFIQLFSEVPMEVLPTPGRSASDTLGRLQLATNEAAVQDSATKIRSIGKPLSPTRAPRGGTINQAGSTVGAVVGFPLGSLLQRVDDTAARFQPYLLTIEGGFLVVTPEKKLTEKTLATPTSRVDFDERGPLGSDQTLTVSLITGEKVIFRRTILHFGYLDQALQQLRDQALISGWEYVGARGQGFGANVVLYNFMGKNRKFMSSLNTWPSGDHGKQPHVQWYVDGMQRLNFSLVTPEGWRQEFVEVPMQVPPIPRDVELFSGKSRLD